jgi:sigma-B regulation protein RsbU (phosphoserine phosphatase)
MIHPRGIAFKLAFFILTSCTIIFGIIFGYNYLVSRRIIIDRIETNARDLALRTVNDIETILLPVAQVPHVIANWLEVSDYSPASLTNSLRAFIDSNTNIYGGTIAYQPYAFISTSLYYSPYFYRDRTTGNIRFTWIGSETYNYFDWEWYSRPRELNHPTWTEPYYDEGAGNIIMCTYSVPFYMKQNGTQALHGVVTADISLSWLQELVSSITIGESGYAFLVSKQGTYVTYPDKSYIMNETLMSIAGKMDNATLEDVAREMQKGNDGFVLIRSIVTGKKCWMYHTTIPSSGWSLAVMFPQHELMAIVTNLNRVVIALGILGIFFLSLVIIIIAGSITRPLRVLSQKTRDIAKGNFDVDVPRMKTRDEVGRLAESFAAMNQALKQYIRDLTETTAAKERMESELKIAHDIQMGIVPRLAPPYAGRKEFDLYAVLQPAREVGGDLYDFFFIRDNLLCLVIGDVSDKGVPAALFMAVTNTFIKAVAEHAATPDEIISQVNKYISFENDSCMFVTMFCAILDINTGEFLYTNGGHNPPLILHNNGHTEYFVLESGMVLGISADAEYSVSSLMLNPGDTIIMYTDGVTEAFNIDGEMFEEDRLKQTAASLALFPVKDMVEGIISTVSSFSHGIPQSDDITILAIRYTR